MIISLLFGLSTGFFRGMYDLIIAALLTRARVTKYYPHDSEVCMEESDIILEALAARLQALEGRVAELEKDAVHGAAGPSSQPKKQSAKEFLIGKTISSELQRVVALAFYLERQEGLTSFNVSDLEGVFRQAREKLPKNMNDAVNKNIARGFLMEAAAKKDSKKAWQLTATGERYVETELSK
jgi:hypothetical protein